MTKLAIVYKQVPDRELLNNSFKDDVEVYNGEDASIFSNYEEIKQKSYDRVALVWKYYGRATCPILYKFIDHPNRKEDRKRKDTHKYPFKLRLYELLIELKKNNDNLVIDLVCCDINKEQFINRINNFVNDTGIQVNYSLDKTGNPEHGGNWIMESSGIDIKDIYFTENINNYTHVLAANQILVKGTDNTTLNLTQAYLDANMGAGFTFHGSTLNFSENITWDSDWYIEVDNDGNNPVTIDGGRTSGYTITVSGDYFDGLILPYHESIVTIQNITITGDTLNSYAGWVVQEMEDSYDTIVTIDNCHADTDIDDDNCGGIAGWHFVEDGVGIVKNCSFTGGIGVGDADGCGGILGQEISYGGICTVYNCYSTGQIYEQGGGISGEYSPDSGGTLYIYNCYSTGDMLSDDAGGICGEDCGYGNSETYITNCYSTGTIGGLYCGGIAGKNCGSYNGRVYITNCYSTGDISGLQAGGICGYDCGDGGDTDGVYIYNCYSTGEISGINSGGIVGSSCEGSSDGYVYVLKCYSKGVVSGTGAGGITGDQSTEAFIYGCYSIGNITGENAGGICGVSASSSGTSVYGCYSLGTISGTNAGGICGNLSNLAIMENCYSTRSSQTATNGTTYIDGTLSLSTLNSSTFYAYGYEAGTSYPKLKNFGRLPWSGYSEYNSSPTLSSVHVLVDGGLDALKIDSLRVSIDSALSAYTHVAPFNIANSLVTAPYNSTWAIEIFSNALGSASSSKTLSDLSSGVQTTLINAFNNFYDTNVTSGFDFGLYPGSILASTLEFSCFCELTQILTAHRGYVKVRSLKIGEELLTKTGQIAKITKIFNVKYSGKIVKVKKDLFGEGIPFKSFNITPDHRMCPKKIWHYPKGKKYVTDEIILFHIETDNKEDHTIMANGVAVETWKPQNPESKLTVE